MNTAEGKYNAEDIERFIGQKSTPVNSWRLLWCAVFGNRPGQVFRFVKIFLGYNWTERDDKEKFKAGGFVPYEGGSSFGEESGTSEVCRVFWSGGVHGIIWPIWDKLPMGERGVNYDDLVWFDPSPIFPRSGMWHNSMQPSSSEMCVDILPTGLKSDLFLHCITFLVARWQWGSVQWRCLLQAHTVLPPLTFYSRLSTMSVRSNEERDLQRLAIKVG